MCAKRLALRYILTGKLPKYIIQPLYPQSRFMHGSQDTQIKMCEILKGGPAVKGIS